MQQPWQPSPGGPPFGGPAGAGPGPAYGMPPRGPGGPPTAGPGPQYPGMYGQPSPTGMPPGPPMPGGYGGPAMAAPPIGVPAAMSGMHQPLPTSAGPFGGPVAPAPLAGPNTRPMPGPGPVGPGFATPPQPMSVAPPGGPGGWGSPAGNVPPASATPSWGSPGPASGFPRGMPPQSSPPPMSSPAFGAGGPPMGAGGPPMGMGGPPHMGPGGPPHMGPGGPHMGPPVGAGGPPHMGPPVGAGGPHMGPPVGAGGPPHMGPGGPHMGPPVGAGGPPMSSPPMSSPPMSGPPMGGPPMGGPPMGGPPMGGPPMGGPPMGGPAMMGSSGPMSHRPSALMPTVASPAPPPMYTPQPRPGVAPPSVPGAQPSAGPAGPAAPSGPAAAPAPAPARVDPKLVPRPAYSSSVITYSTNTPTAGPPSTLSNFVAIDAGRASPRFARPTVANIPQDSGVLERCKLPLGVVFQPLAATIPGEIPVPVVEFTQMSDILRCNRCRGYVNPAFKFIASGRKYVCNLCNHTNDVPDPYYCSLDQFGLRRDRVERPELSFGTVEFVAPASYATDRTPQPMAYVFVIEATYQAVQSGVTAAALASVRECVHELGRTPGVKIGLVIFNSSVHFFNMDASRKEPVLTVMADIDDPFAPLPSQSWLPSISDARAQIDAALERVMGLFHTTNDVKSCMGAAVAAAIDGMRETPGRLLLFQSTLPELGVGKLSPREDMRQYLSETERDMYNPTPKEGAFYAALAEKAVTAAVCVELYACSTNFMDLANVAQLCTATNGQVQRYTGFGLRPEDPSLALLYEASVAEAQLSLLNDIRRSCTRETGVDGVVRVRTSPGLALANYLGNCTPRTVAEMNLAGIDADKSFGVSMSLDGKMDKDGTAHIQCALLYTTRAGQRRVRVHNLALSVTDSETNMFKFADMDAILNMILKESARQMRTEGVVSLRRTFTDQAIEMLYVYRYNCARRTTPAQLILPEALKHLPLFANALLKTGAFRQNERPLLVMADERTAELVTVTSLSIQHTLSFLYPRFVSLHNLSDDAGYPPRGSKADLHVPEAANLPVVVPDTLWPSAARLDLEGVYLLVTNHNVFVYIAERTSPAVLESLFGVNAPELVTPGLIEHGTSDVLRRIQAIIAQLSRNATQYLPIKVLNHKSRDRIQFTESLVEDRCCGYDSYVDFLCRVHSSIQTRMQSG